MTTFDINKFKGTTKANNRYEKRLGQLKNRYTESIEETVPKAIENIKNKNSRSFVIYGEPQSGKTEMMIALTAKLLDSGFKIIILLINDNVELLNQNLNRFIKSGIDPAPNEFSEILDPDIKIANKDLIIFCKKNSKNLQKLIDKIKSMDNKVIIDDEADFATPNSKINKGEKNKINELIEKLLGENGIYIGVTATPARLDLNKTFENENDKWIYFRPHPDYAGQEIFFPTSFNHGENKLGYKLELLPDAGDDPKYLKKALFRFLINVARLNTSVNSKEQNYSMLVHTSGKNVDQTKDYKLINQTLEILRDNQESKFESYIEEIWCFANKIYVGLADVITSYIVENIAKHRVVIMNGETDKKNVDYSVVTTPECPFTIVIGGNIISRGVTFNNLLSMFFTRDTKHKIQQDTYIQRARMFGNRLHYLEYFELSIPEQLYLDWHKCFVFHRLSLTAITQQKGSPVWLEDKRVSAAAKSAIDKTAVSMESGEMSFAMFDYSEKIDSIIYNSQQNKLDKLKEISSIIGDDCMPEYLIDFIVAFSIDKPEESIGLHPTRSIQRSTEYHDTIERPKGLFGTVDIKAKGFENSIHHIMIHKNTFGQARVVYKYNGSIKTIKRIQKQSRVLND